METLVSLQSPGFIAQRLVANRAAQISNGGLSSGTGKRSLRAEFTV